MVEIWRWDGELEVVKRALAGDRVLAVPTESSYGLAVDPRSGAGVEAVYRLKERDRGKPLPVVAADVAQALDLGVEQNEAVRMAAVHWPAPLTVVAPLRSLTPVAGSGCRLPKRTLTVTRSVALVLGLLVAGVLLPAAPVGAQETVAAARAESAAPVDLNGGEIGVDEVSRGQTGYGLSVFAGSEPDRFGVEVVGVIREMDPGTSYIVARLSGNGLEESGVVAGMSGSPVYLDGRLAGAVAYSRSFTSEALALITPIAAMRELPAGRADTVDMPDLGAGSAVAGVLIDGDLKVAVGGTVTRVEDGEVLAMGHPYLGVGPLRVPMATVEVVGVVPRVTLRCGSATSG